MKKAILIQSRLSSSRFPRKMISKISGDLTLVEYVYHRCKNSNKADIVAIITSNESSDDELYNLCIEKNIPVFRGDLNNVLDRYVKAGEHYNIDTICRVCGDSPFVDIELIDKMFNDIEEEKLDYIVFENSLNGFLSEVIHLNILKDTLNITDNKDDLEHVTRYIRNNLVKFKHKLIDSNLKPNDLKGITLTVDYKEDLNLAKKIVKYLKDFNFTSNNIIDILRENRMSYVTPKFPKRVEIELVSDCNLKCTYCPRHFVNELTGYMDFELFKKIINEVSVYPDTVLVLHRRGESMLHPRFSDMLNLISGKFKDIQMATNATQLSEDKFEAIVNSLSFLSFSLDTPENFNKTRIPAKYETVEKKILKFLEYNKGRVKTQASMVKTSSTPKELCDEFVTIWQDRVDRVRIYEEHSTDGNFGSLANPRKERKPCVMPIYEVLIYDNGVVARCNHDWDSDGMGDVNKNSIKEIWHSEKYVNLRKQHLELNLTDPICSKCDSWYPEIGKQGTGEVVEDE